MDKERVSKYGQPQAEHKNKGFKQIDHKKQDQVAREEAKKEESTEENPQRYQEHRRGPNSMNKMQSRKTAPDLQMSQPGSHNEKDSPPNDSDAGSQ